jgi:hypothetical protein
LMAGPFFVLCPGPIGQGRPVHQPPVSEPSPPDGPGSRSFDRTDLPGLTGSRSYRNTYVVPQSCLPFSPVGYVPAPARSVIYMGRLTESTSAPLGPGLKGPGPPRVLDRGYAGSCIRTSENPTYRKVGG